MAQTKKWERLIERGESVDVLRHQLLIPPLGLLQLPLQRRHQLNEPINIDPSLTHILFELLGRIHPEQLTDPTILGSASSTDWTATFLECSGLTEPSIHLE